MLIDLAGIFINKLITEKKASRIKGHKEKKIDSEKL